MVKDVFTYAAARLFLNWLGGVTSVGRPRAEELVSAVREYVDATFMPA
ncbi:hypothetical protein [Vulcanisaeta distributa]|nr:hypothetical protein [Vulcanisaeta distributa]